MKTSPTETQRLRNALKRCTDLLLYVRQHCAPGAAARIDAELALLKTSKRNRP